MPDYTRLGFRDLEYVLDQLLGGGGLAVRFKHFE